MVSADSRMLSAISFGVFCRLAPSMREIMRSRKLSPGIGGHPDPELIGDDGRPGGDGGAVAARLAQDRAPTRR